MGDIGALQEWITSFPDVIQWFGVLLLGSTPYVEAFLAIFAGVLAGIEPWVVISSALLGNMLSLLIFIAAGERINAWFVKRDKFSKSRKKFIEKFNKYGLIGTALLGPLLLPTQVLGILMVTVAQANTGRTILWLGISIVLWSSMIFGLTFLIPGGVLLS